MDQVVHRLTAQERGKDPEGDQAEGGKDDMIKKEGTTWSRTAPDRRERALMGGYIP